MPIYTGLFNIRFPVIFEWDFPRAFQRVAVVTGPDSRSRLWIGYSARSSARPPLVEPRPQQRRQTYVHNAQRYGRCQQPDWK